jgi:hypothetical protein
MFGRAQLVRKLWITFPVGTPQRPKNKQGRGFPGVLLATMKVQQAVAKRSVGRRVKPSTCLFFGSGTALRAFTSLRDMSLHRSGFAAVAGV